jgi:predicted secreted protein
LNPRAHFAESIGALNQLHRNFRRSAAQRSRQAPNAAACNYDGFIHVAIVPLLQPQGFNQIQIPCAPSTLLKFDKNEVWLSNEVALSI